MRHRLAIMLTALFWPSTSSVIGADEMTIAINVTIRQPPVILSGPTASPNPAKTGDTITFGVSAASPDNAPLSYTWKFGDGTTESGASVTHVYTRAGVYAVIVLVSDDIDRKCSNQIIVTINDVEGEGGLPPPPPLPWTVTKAQVSLNFKQVGCDKVKILGALDLPAGWDPKDKIVLAGVGNNTVSFTLNAKGCAKVGKNVFKLSRKLKKKVFLGGTVKISYALSGDLAVGLASAGMTNATTPKTGMSVTMDAPMTLDNQPYLAQVPLLWKAVANASGKAKK